MKTNSNVIFLIESEILEKELFTLALQKITNHKVFSFFSLEESQLYMSLNPLLIIMDNNQSSDADISNVKILNIFKLRNTLLDCSDKNLRVRQIAHMIFETLKERQIPSLTT